MALASPFNVRVMTVWWIAAVFLGVMLGVAALAFFGMWLATRPPVEGDVGEWRHVGNGTRWKAFIEPGGAFVTLTSGSTAQRIERDDFCRHYDRVRKPG